MGFGVVNAVPGPSLWQRLDDIVLTVTTKVVDSEDLDDFGAIEYIIYLKNPSNERARLHIAVINNNGVTEYQVYTRSGKAFNIEVKVTDTATDAELKVVNNELVDLDVTILKAVT